MPSVASPINEKIASNSTVIFIRRLVVARDRPRIIDGS